MKTKLIAAVFLACFASLASAQVTDAQARNALQVQASASSVHPFCKADFLEKCRNSIAPGGHLAFNYIVNDEQEWQQVKDTFTRIFPPNKIIASSVNRILIGSC